MRKALTYSCSNLYSVLGFLSNIVGVNLILANFMEYAQPVDEISISMMAQYFILIAVYFISSLPSFWLMESKVYLGAGRRKMLMIGSLGMSACLFVVTFYTFYKIPAVSYLLILVYLVFYQISIGTVFWVYASDVLVDKSLSMAVSFMWIASVGVNVITYLFISSIHSGTDIRAAIPYAIFTFFAICVIPIQLFLFSKYLLFETNKLSREEIEAKFASK